ncbi:MAG: DUF1571 domain-containing protein [Planctomycetes bacterium]|nr:DUF1571 domain-containing protein [Planctomycetota bacterium]
MSRRLLVVAAGVLALSVAGLVFVGYEWLLHGEPPPPPPEFKDSGATLSSQQQFDKLAETDPVKMFAECLTRYQREVKDGLHCTIRMQERVKGEPKPPAVPPVEVIDVWVRGDVPNSNHHTAIEVLMKWTSGAKKPSIGFGAEIRGTLFSEKPAPEGLGGKVVTYRPGAIMGEISKPVDPNTDLAKSQSRYCVRDAGLYRSMLRTYEAWKTRQAAGELKFEYLGRQKPEHVGRECHVIRRVCPRVEIDAFEVGGTASTDPKVVAVEGFTEVTIFVDVERWLQVGTELYRTEPDGTRVLVGTYHFRDVQLNPSFPPDTFTEAGLKR